MEAPPSGGMEGQVIAAKYQLVRLLGQGGMGAVYEGRNQMTYKRCAVKVLLSPELATNTDLVRRFFREARAGAVIESDHVVEVFDSGVDPATGCPYMVMEFLAGEDIEGTMKRLGVIDPTAALKIVLQASIGLAKAHEASIVHRDIKPANLFITQRDSGDLIVKILDFGIAKVKMENFHETSTGLTRTGSLLGTPLYMSPEQCKGASTIDARSDVWSLGVVLWEMLTGGTPYSNASSLGSLMASIITEELPLIQDRAPWVPPELAEIVHRAMSRDASRRFQNAAELRDALLAIAPGGPMLLPQMMTSVPSQQKAFIAPRLVLTDEGMLRATARTGLSITQTGSPKKRSSGAFVAASLLAVTVIGVGGAAVYKLTQKPEPEPAPSHASTALPPPQLPATPEPLPVVTPQASIKSFPLEVAPAGVEVSVDGAAGVVKDGKVMLEGTVGATRRVKLSFKGKSEERVVAIVQEGLVPERLELGVAPRIAPPRTAKLAPAAGDAPKPAAEAAKPAAKTAAAPPKKAAGLAEGTDEFK